MKVSRMLILSIASAALLLAAPIAAAAQGEPDLPALGTGWVEVLDGAGLIAGSPEQGYVVLGGTDYERGRTDAFYSATGADWAPIDIDTPIGDPWGVTGVALGPAGFLAVSGMPGEDDVDERFVAVSSDGSMWERLGGETLPDGKFAHTVTTGPGGYIAEVVNPGACPSTSGLWFSSNGQVWNSSDAPLSGCGSVATASSESGWHLIAGSSSLVRIASSSDGLVWTESEAEQPPPSAAFRYEIPLGVSGDTWMLMTFTEDVPGPSPGLWVSTDAGNTWTDPAIEINGDSPLGDYQPHSWTVTDQGFYGVGLIEDLTDNDQGFLLFSADGASWHLFILEGCCTGLVETAGGLLGVGSSVYSWQPGLAELAVTGPAHTETVLMLAIGLVMAGAAAGLVGRVIR